MFFLNFWMFRVMACLITLYFFVQIVSTSGLEDTPFQILIPFALPLIALFWINYPKIYFKYIYKDKEISKKIRKKTKKKKRKTKNVT